MTKKLAVFEPSISNLIKRKIRMKLNRNHLVSLCILAMTNQVLAEDVAPYKPQQKDSIAPLSKEMKLTKKVGSDFNVIGIDKRYRPGKTTKYPYRVIGQLNMTSHNGKHSTCSATLISQSHVLTAAHCVYDRDSRSFLKNIQFIPGRDGKIIPYGVYGATDAYIPKAYPGSTWLNNNADIAVLKLSSSIGYELGHMGYGIYQDLPESIHSSINEHAGYLQQQNYGNKKAGAKAVTEYIENVHQQYPDYALSYFGYSGDKKSQVWGDTCLAWKLNNLSTEKHVQFQSFCDLQGGASGSGYTDKDNYIRGVVSWGQSSDSSAIRNSSGKKTGFFQGDVSQVSNVGAAISGYSFNLIQQWVGGQYGDDSLHYKFEKSYNYKRVTINNKCHDKVWIAMRLKDRNGDWVNQGFFETEPYSKVAVTITSNYFYYFAATDGMKRTWKGKDTYQTLYGEEFGFRRREASDKYESTINLTCS